jgi:HD-GYP domain-containing protein (c-di-GMP phosphodiesterase class II)
MTTEATQETTENRILKPIDIQLLGIGTTLDFPIYVRGQGDRRFKLFQGPNLKFSKNTYDRIQEDYQGRAYVYPEHLDSFVETVNATLSNSFSDPDKNPDEKVQALMYHVDANLNRVLEQGNSDTVPNFEDVSAYPDHVAQLLDNEPNTKGLITEFLGKNDSLASHCLQVCFYGMMIIDRHFPERFSEEEKKQIGLGFLSHDIGKVQIGTSIIEKTGKPTRMQWKVLQQVPERGIAILNKWGGISDLALDIVRNHRERYDGSGYPRALRGEEIPLLARICCVADDFSSLTSKKAYRPALSPYDALWIMRVDNKGSYDPAVLKLFLSTLIR